MPEQGVVRPAVVLAINSAEIGSAKRFVDAAELLEGFHKAMVRVAIEGPVELLIKTRNPRRPLFPGGSGAVNDAPPIQTVQRLAVIIPHGVVHANGAALLTFTHKSADVD